MKVFTNVTDPDDKKKKGVKLGRAEKETGTRKKGLNQELLRRGREAAKNVPDVITGKAKRTYEGAAAPRVGGKVEASIGVSKGGSKKQVKASIKRAKKSMGSSQAKKAAIRALKNRY